MAVLQKIIQQFIESSYNLCILLHLLRIWPPQVAPVGKNPPANAGDDRGAALIPESGRSPGEGNGNPLQYSCLENHMDRGAWWATVHGVARSQTRLSN